MLHVYAIVDSPVTPGAAGLDGVELRLVGDRPPFAVASEHLELPSPPSEDDLWAHEEVVEELMEHATVLPMRFDGAVADETELRRILDRRREEFEGVLDEVRGAVELGVRASPAEGPEDDEDEMDGASEAGPGTAYLLERARRRRRLAETVSRVHEPLAALARRSRRSAGQPGGQVGLKASYLVDRGLVDAFRAKVESLDAELGSGRIVCTGPWPPYGFSSREET